VFAYDNPFEFSKSVKIVIVVSKQAIPCHTIKHENETISKNALENH
jgi:hypothetical protein